MSYLTGDFINVQYKFSSSLQFLKSNKRLLLNVVLKTCSCL